ncbi:glycosyltransferase family protein [Eubacterium sp. MSJ-13]|uniref:glycosyltransferase family protein n=1 Tax=Eubacterium sp. MSJ-13 TaxID=2841513 RepID=UPI001C127CF5|nr:glycosyltransferase family protein [Eubacterium sp. MSJ-13]MBU5477778.1 glycosyltransferase family protein [Eubacterium sp. MSJ-13]
MEDSRKVCFVICYNDENYLSECLLYIRNLNIPDGYTIEVIQIKDAESMAAGYQAAMEDTDAKYMVYLHQDVFILEKDFIEKTIQIFKSDDNIGMIGMVGTKKLPDSAVMWETKMRVGLLRACTLGSADDNFDLPMENPYTEVEAVDGLLIMTNRHDVSWRMDIFDGWDFYDVSQSEEYRKKGYKVVVPYQEKPWTLHDCDFLNMANYDKYRKKFLREYRK